MQQQEQYETERRLQALLDRCLLNLVWYVVMVVPVLWFGYALDYANFESNDMEVPHCWHILPTWLAVQAVVCCITNVLGLVHWSRKWQPSTLQMVWISGLQLFWTTIGFWCTRYCADLNQWLFCGMLASAIGWGATEGFVLLLRALFSLASW